MLSTGICRWLFLLISLSTWTKLIDSKEMRIVCYYTNWSVYRPGQAKFSPQNINPYLCTHLVYAFGGFTKENTLKPFDKYQDIEKGGYAKFTGLKTYNKNLKTLIAIGGWNEGSSRFSPMVANADRRKELVKNTIKFLRQNHFDGLDLDWEYPTFRDGGKTRDRDNYAQLVKELREEFERESEKTGRPRLLLTMAVPAGIEYINKGYDVPKLTKYLDWMNILSYDYHSAFEPAVNHHAPLYSLEEDNEYNYDGELNIDYTIKHYLKLGADPNKLILGIPTYGRSYTLFNPDAFEIGSPADGPGDMGEATRENGYLAYYEICEYVKDQDWEVDEPDPKAMGPIAFKDNQWVGYDDENIVRKKAEYVAEQSLGGIMFWAIDNDDFRGNCHGKPYPLIEAGKEALLNAYGLTEENLISPPSKPTKSTKKSRPRPSKTTTTTTTTEEPEEISVSSISTNRRRRIKTKSSRGDDRSSSLSAKRRKDTASKTAESSTYSSLRIVTPAYTTPAPPATPDMGGAFKCEDEGFYPHPKDCKKYFWCLGGPGDSGIVAHQFTCPAGLYFNKAADSCDYSQNVFCNKKLQKATTEKSEESSSSESSTSQKPTPSSIFSTSRAPPKITAATSKTTVNFRTTTTTTTTEAYEDEYEYEDEEEEPSKKSEPEEDPKVIKELIDLIRKAGGIEELEKQLKFGKDDEASTASSDSTTPSAISKSLYERVLSKTSKNSLSALKRTSLNRNSGGPQGDRNEEKKDKKPERGRLQYRTLNRQRPSTEKSADNESEEDEEEKEVEKKEVKEKKSFRTKSQLEYVNIRRPKSSTTTEANDDDGFSRNKILGELEEDDEEDDSEDTEEVTKRNNALQYVNIRRQRPSTTEASETSSKYASIRRSTVSPIEPETEDSQETKKYKPIRRGSTTEASSASDEPTSLRYQTIRRGTTTTPVSIAEDDVDSLRTRSTTVSSVSNENTELKASSSRQSTTSTPSEEEADSTAKYQTIKRESTTQATASTTEEPKSTSDSQELSTDNITETDLPGTTLPQESLSTNNTVTTENIVTSTYKTTTESNTDVTSTTLSNRSGLADTENAESETKKNRPVLFQPRPFSVGIAKSTTPDPTTTVTAKVSQSSFKFRVRPNTSSPSSNPTTEPVTTTVRSRSRNRYSNINRNLSEDAEQEEKYERTVENKPVRTRKRVLVTTETPIDFNEEANRKYRPAELADLSSLTAVDLKNLRGGDFVSNNKRRRPTTALPGSTTTEGALDKPEKTGSKLGKSRRPVTDDQLNASSDHTSTTRKIGRGFRSTTPKAISNQSSSTTAATEKAKVTPRTRKIIRRFRPGASTTSTTEKPATLSSTTSSTIEIPRKRIPLFRQRQNKNAVTPSSVLNATTTTEFALESTSVSSESPLLKLFKTRSRFDISKNETAGLVDDEDEDELSNEHTDVLNGEEGENIKLSESNIRESSQINTFGFDKKSGKRKFGKSKETALAKPAIEKQQNGKLETTTAIPENLETTRGPEPARILRTRKIIRKLSTTSSTEPTTTTTKTADTENDKALGRKRKILRRLRPTNANDLESKSEEKNVESSTKKYIFRGRSTTEATSSVAPQEVTEEIKSRRTFKPSFGKKTTEKIEGDEEHGKFEPNKFRVFRPTTESYSTSSSTPEYNLYPKRTFSTLDSDIDENDDDNDDQEDDEGSDGVDDTDDEEDGRNLDEDDTPVYTIYTTSSIARTHKFESNTQFNDEDEEDFDKNLTANKSIKSHILKTALNSRNESKTILDDTNEGNEKEHLKEEETNRNDTTLRSNNLLKPQKERPSFLRQRLALGKEEVKTKSQQDLLKTQPGFRSRITTEQPKTELVASSSVVTSSIQHTTESGSTDLPELDSTTALVAEAISDAKDNISIPVSETTENIDITTVIINGSTKKDDDTGATDAIFLTTTEEIKETTFKHVTDEPIAITHPDEIDETTVTESDTEDITSTNDLLTSTDSTMTQNPEGSTAPILSNLTESTTEYHRRSTLRSIRDRPKLGLTRRTNGLVAGSASTTEPTIDGGSKKPFTRGFGKNRLKKPSSTKPPIKSLTFGGSRSTSPLPLNKFLYKYSTTERTKVEPEQTDLEEDNESGVEDEDDDNENTEDEGEEAEDTTQSPKPLLLRSSTTPRVVNKPVDSRKFKKTSNKPKFLKTTSSTSSTTETVALEDLGVDTEAVKNRNKNLFSKRKMNTPILLSSTTSAPDISSAATDTIEITTFPSTSQSDSTEPSLTTLHHIFAEIENSDTTTESMSSSQPAGKIERLIEVNRIVEINTRQEKIKNHTSVEENAKVEINPTLDKIGEISRITLIKIVDGNNETIFKDPESNEIGTSLETTSLSSPSFSPSEDLKYPLEVAKVEEIPASKVIQNVSLANFQFDIKLDNGQREERKFEIFGESKVANNKELTNLNGKPEIIDGISHINVVSPKPLLVTEASTISLQGLFQSEKPHLNPSFTSNDEVLETGRSEYVNVRVLDQDPEVRLDKGLRGSTNFVPVRVLSQDNEESTVKAHVMEISPKPDSRTIKIVPIRVEMSRSLASAKLPPKT